MFFIVTILTLSVVLYFTSYRRRLAAESKSVLITGCDSGIGLYLAQSLRDKGFNVFAACLSSASKGYETLTEMGTRHEGIHTIIMDVTEDESVQSAVEEVEKLTNADLWAVINNAGVCIFGEFDWLTRKQCQQQVDVNFLGIVRVTKSFLPLIKKSSGRFLAISSINGLVAFPGTAVYSGTKFALEGFYDALRVELKKLGIGVILVELADLGKCTDLFSNHRQRADEMRRNMSNEDNRLYCGYFDAFHESTIKNVGCTGPRDLQSTSIAEDIFNELLMVKPRARIFIASAPYKVFVGIQKFLPTFVLDFIFQKVIIEKGFKVKFNGIKRIEKLD